MTDDKQVRVILWCIPRTVSTAFEKCMSNLDDVQIINEPYISAYSIGPEKIPTPEIFREEEEKFVAKAEDVELGFDAGGWDTNKATYKFIKENVLEAEYPDKKVVFVKDMSYGIAWKLHMLPEGYRHAFLIRNPVKVFTSWKKLLNNMLKEMSSGLDLVLENKNNIVPEKYAFGESFQLYEHLVKTGIEPNPVIIDSDDLLENPELVLKEFCNRTGVTYKDELLNWNAGDSVIQKWKFSNTIMQGNQFMGYYKEAFASQKFYKAPSPADRADLPEDVNKCIDEAMPYYEKMYQLRIRADQTAK
ncbi:uncharacterized protein [Antedon mediterranea]|uniref:uncharacterized protein n=1 Tax=Antedon mediterranea TaxID=105859 RepID=UPI003AF4E0F2